MNEYHEIRPKLGRNPFAQPKDIWELKFRVRQEQVQDLEEQFAGALAVSSFEDEKDPKFWAVEVLVAEEPKLRAIKKQLNGRAYEPRIVRVEMKNWQVAIERDFPPLKIGRFFVHGAHARRLLPRGAWGVQVEAGMAFGSGEHATTSGCLLAIDRLARRRRIRSVLDMGCGSGILAIAAARAWPRARQLAVDVDPVSVRVAQANMRKNRLHLRAARSDGYRAKAVRAFGPYDLILSNILARPLVQFSRALAAHLAPGGIAVLSGLLSTQAAYVLAAHRRQGLRLERRIVRDGWTTLVMVR